MVFKKMMRHVKINEDKSSDKTCSDIDDMSNIGNILLYMGAITKSDLEAAVKRQSESCEKLGQILLNLRMIEQVDLELAIVKQIEMRKKGSSIMESLHELWQMNMNRNKEVTERKEVAINQMWKKVEQIG